MTFVVGPSDQARIERGMAIDFWYIRKHPMTDEPGVARIALRWDEESGDWQLPDENPTLPHILEGSDIFVTEDEARQALARGEWRHESTGDDPL